MSIKASPKPPMGWNSWDNYAAKVTEQEILQNAEVMSRKLLKYGWEYVVCDIQWSAPLAPGDIRTYRPFVKLNTDGFSRLIPDEERFPSSANNRGFKPLADKIHDMGLKFGIHIMRGIPRQCAHSREALLGTNVNAADIADPHSISRWNGDMYGLIDCPAAQSYYDSLFNLYAEWGVDFVKIDDICNTNMYPHIPYSARREIEMYRKAADKCGRQMVISLSPGPAVLSEGWHLRQNADMWRITDDFWDDWNLLKDMFHRCEQWQTHVSAGSWPDCDMLPLGKIGEKFGDGRKTRFTQAEQITMMTLWSIFRSPLILGCDLTAIDDWTLNLITNSDVLEANQNGFAPVQLKRDENEAIWQSSDGKYLALFNLSDESRDLVLDKNKKFRDLWEKTDNETGKIAIPAHGAKLYKVI